MLEDIDEERHDLELNLTATFALRDLPATSWRQARRDMDLFMHDLTARFHAITCELDAEFAAERDEVLPEEARPQLVRLTYELVESEVGA